MNPSLVRLLLAGNRGDRFRLAAMALGVALGVALALLLTTGFTAIAARGERGAWTDVFRQLQLVGAAQSFDDGAQLQRDQVVARNVTTRFADDSITVLQVAAQPDTTVRLPGVGTPPEPGTSWVSPALAELIAAHPSDQLGERFGTVVGRIPDSALAGPDVLVAVTGVAASDLTGEPIFTGLRGTPFANGSYAAIAAIGAVALGVPVLMLLAVVTSLGSAKRAERLAVLRLLGAGPNALGRLAAAEAALTGVAGAALGVALAWLAASPLARVSINGSQFFPDDLRAGPLTSLTVALGVTTAAALIALLRARLAPVGPLGASRERLETRPGVARVLPLIAGLALFGLMLTGWTQVSASVLAVPAFVLTVLGLLAVGPLVVAGVGSVVGRRAPSAATVIALGRVQRHPRQSFRAVSGVVVATFLVAAFSTALTTMSEPPEPVPGAIDPELLVAQPYTPVPTTDAAARRAIAGLRQVEGVELVVVVAMDTADDSNHDTYVRGSDAAALGYQNDARYLRINPDLMFEPVQLTPVAHLPRHLAVEYLLVVTGPGAPRERARTYLVASGLSFSALTSDEQRETYSRGWAGEFAVLAELGTLVAAGISALALAAATLAGVLDRRRVFALLRLTGMPASELRRTIAAEAAIPLVSVLAAVSALGVGVGWVLVRSLSDGRRTVTWPGLDFLLLLGFTLAAAALAVLATMRVAEQSTSRTITRFE